MIAVSHIDVQPAALLATASANTTLETLNDTMRPYGLCLPLEPLEHGLTLAELMARNAGGRRQLAYGTIARYLRAATVEMEDGRVLRLGGPTLKRATGYALQRVLVGGGQAYLPGARTLLDITLNVRPLPPARHELFVMCDDLPAACRLATQIMQAGMAPGALALMNDRCFGLADDGTTTATEGREDAVLLVELEGLPAVLERQVQQLAALAEQANALVATSDRYETAQPYASQWEAWEEAAEQWSSAVPALTLPRAALPDFTAQAQQVARRYGLTLLLWGDAGVGRLHMRLDSAEGRAASEQQQALAVLGHLARQAGGVLCTDQPAAQRPAAEPFTLGSTQARTTLDRDALLERLRALLGSEHVLTREGDVLCYAADASIASADGLPLAVVLPASTEQVSSVLRLAHQAGVPVVTRGAGSGLAGGSTSSEGGLVLALTRMERFSIDPVQQVAHAEAGVVTAEVQRAAEQHGLLYVPDPSSQGVSTIGGNIACNAGGPRCLKYGVTTSYVLGLTAVLADGRIVRVGDGLTAQTPDVGLLHLLAGSEGTLGVITEATLGLIARPAARRTTLAYFARLDDACATVEAIMASGVLPAGLELMDDTSIRVVEDALHLGLPRDAGALLLMLADGAPEAVEWEAQQLAELARRGGASHVQVASNAADEAGFWQARRSVSPAFARVQPNKLGEDICVPLPQIAHTVRRINEIATRFDLPIPVFGHAGDGNLHPNILFDRRDADQRARAWQAAEAIFAVALEVGGTLSGEHGIGTLKRPFLAAALGDDVLALHHAIKARLDPRGLLNPGKVV
jgi:glycolate oxidase subunit GlcD